MPNLISRRQYNDRRKYTAGLCEDIRKRVAARLGSGGLSHDTSCIIRNDQMARRTDHLFWHIWERINKYEYRKPEKLDIVRIDGEILDEAYKFNRDKIPLHLHAEIKIEPWKLHKIIENLSWPSHPSAPSYPPEEPEVFFYHSDHLGGASWITDGDGNPVQHLQYLPFGQPFVDQHPAGYQERFTFTGKERDEETGYGYFGARYMDHELMTMWLSVDPMADKYPSISPYAYCAWNPVKLVDPDGLDTIISFACRTLDAEQNRKNQRLGECIRNIGDSPHVLAIAMHGSSKEMQTSTGNGEVTKPLTAKQMADRITNMTDGSSLYVDNLEKGKSTIIILYSCNTGQGEDCFGQQLSKELESSVVIAPEGVVWAGINKNGQTTIDNAKNIGTAKNPKKGSRQNWNIYVNGEKVSSFRGAPQAWINRQGGINKVLEKIQNHNE